MNKVNSNKKYKIVNEVYDESESESIPKMIVQYGILAIICILTFLIAKYIVINDINGEKTPIDTSERI